MAYVQPIVKREENVDGEWDAMEKDEKRMNDDDGWGTVPDLDSSALFIHTRPYEEDDEQQERKSENDDTPLAHALNTPNEWQCACGQWCELVDGCCCSCKRKRPDLLKWKQQHRWECGQCGCHNSLDRRHCEACDLPRVIRSSQPPPPSAMTCRSHSVTSAVNSTKNAVAPSSDRMVQPEPHYWFLQCCTADHARVPLLKSDAFHSSRAQSSFIRQLDAQLVSAVNVERLGEAGYHHCLRHVIAAQWPRLATTFGNGVLLSIVVGYLWVPLDSTLKFNDTQQIWDWLHTLPPQPSHYGYESLLGLQKRMSNSHPLADGIFSRICFRHQIDISAASQPLHLAIVESQPSLISRYLSEPSQYNRDGTGEYSPFAEAMCKWLRSSHDAQTHTDSDVVSPFLVCSHGPPVAWDQPISYLTKSMPGLEWAVDRVCPKLVQNFFDCHQRMRTDVSDQRRASLLTLAIMSRSLAMIQTVHSSCWFTTLGGHVRRLGHSWTRPLHTCVQVWSKDESMIRVMKLLLPLFQLSDPRSHEDTVLHTLVKEFALSHVASQETLAIPLARLLIEQARVPTHARNENDLYPLLLLESLQSQIDSFTLPTGPLLSYLRSVTPSDLCAPDRSRVLSNRLLSVLSRSSISSAASVAVNSGVDVLRAKSKSSSTSAPSASLGGSSATTPFSGPTATTTTTTTVSTVGTAATTTTTTTMTPTITNPIIAPASFRASTSTKSNNNSTTSFPCPVTASIPLLVPPVLPAPLADALPSATGSVKTKNTAIGGMRTSSSRGCASKAKRSRFSLSAFKPTATLSDNHTNADSGLFPAFVCWNCGVAWFTQSELDTAIHARATPSLPTSTALVGQSYRLCPYCRLVLVETRLRRDVETRMNQCASCHVTTHLLSSPGNQLLLCTPACMQCQSPLNTSTP